MVKQRIVKYKSKAFEFPKRTRFVKTKNGSIIIEEIGRFEAITIKDSEKGTIGLIYINERR
jgi:hypothetical protein